jgi:hypothetical protein
MPKYDVETTVIYRFQVEAESKVRAIGLGFDFEDHQWVLEVENVDVKEVEDN